jgi:hypothetical protein
MQTGAKMAKCVRNFDYGRRALKETRGSGRRNAVQQRVAKKHPRSMHDARRVMCCSRISPARCLARFGYNNAVCCPACAAILQAC